VSIIVPTAVLRVVAELRDRVALILGKELLDVRLFGSYARGQAHEDSDIDVFVLLRACGHPEWRQVMDVAGELWAETGLRLSPTIMDEPTHQVWLAQERALVMDVEREGIRP
jgi:predicted nucleotidyltransferase